MEGHDMMNEQHGTVQRTSTQYTPARGILMFKDHVAAMKNGSKLLGGEREVGQTKEHSTESE